jgi:protein subunit release factor A
MSALNAALRERFERLALRLTELDATLADPAVAADIKRYRAVSREQAEVAGVVGTWRRYQQRERDLAAPRRCWQASRDGELAELAREEAAAAGTDLERLAAELQAALCRRTRTTRATPSSKSAPAPAATSRRCSPATWRACTCAGANARAGAPRS